MVEALLKRISRALGELDIGVSQSQARLDPIRAINTALTEIGAPRLNSLEPGPLRRAASALEGAI